MGSYVVPPQLMNCEKAFLMGFEDSCWILVFFIVGTTLLLNGFAEALGLFALKFDDSLFSFCWFAEAGAQAFFCTDGSPTALNGFVAAALVLVAPQGSTFPFSIAFEAAVDVADAAPQTSCREGAAPQTSPNTVGAADADVLIVPDGVRERAVPALAHGSAGREAAGGHVAACRDGAAAALLQSAGGLQGVVAAVASAFLGAGWVGALEARDAALFWEAWEASCWGGCAVSTAARFPFLGGAGCEVAPP